MIAGLAMYVVSGRRKGSSYVFATRLSLVRRVRYLKVDSTHRQSASVISARSLQYSRCIYEKMPKDHPPINASASASRVPALTMYACI